ncbi:MAG: LacI family DNA-binding transcriptional regulator [Coriobacteriales bacterium]|nr:LacI family DNA-binding transcriptional regulator [Coriobacteriales bacterium]
MALKRVTMQDIADACGLSRNTVSKVFNGRGSVPEATKNLVIATARELGYYQYSIEGVTGKRQNGNIALLTQHKLMGHSFGVYFLSSFTDQISRFGYTLQMYEVSPEDLTDKVLPALLDLEHVVGIVGIELFDREYINMVCSLGKPTVFVDCYPHVVESLIHCDFVSMENVTSETVIVNHMISGGARQFGFVGDVEHCNSFYERWIGFCGALNAAGLSVNRDLCILKEDSDLYGDVDWMLEQLDALPYMPDAFVCANDFLAIKIMNALKRKGLSIPSDVMVSGFGGSPESGVVEPSLTTAKIPSSDIGRFTATLIAKRIQQPNFTHHWTYVKTTPVWGDSTR